MATWAPSQPSQHLQHNFIALEFAVKSFDFSVWPMKQYSYICPFGKLSTGDQIPKAGRKGLLAFHVLCRDSYWRHPNLKIGFCLPVMYHFINVSKRSKSKKKKERKRKKETLGSVLLFFSFFCHVLQGKYGGRPFHSCPFLQVMMCWFRALSGRSPIFLCDLIKQGLIAIVFPLYSGLCLLSGRPPVFKCAQGIWEITAEQSSWAAVSSLMSFGARQVRRRGTL